LRWIKGSRRQDRMVAQRSPLNERGAAMIRIVCLLLTLPVLAAVLFVANDRWDLSLIGTLAAVTLIVGFAAAAAGWTIRHDV
jgi:hypothetical protein